MSHFYGDLQGSRGEATCCGTKNSGISAHVRGWDFGIEVDGSALTDEHGLTDDVFAVYMTGGSNGSGSRKLIGYFHRGDMENGDA